MAYRRRYARRPATRKRRYSRAPTYRRRPTRAVARRTRTRRPGVMRSAQQKNIGGTTPKYIKALINPFDKDSYGVRIPDTSTAPSSAIHCYDSNVITVRDGNLFAAANIYVPSSNSYTYLTTGISTTTIAAAAGFGGATATSKATSIQSNYSLCRPVSHGIRITCPLGATSAAGYCHVALIPLSMHSTTWILPTTVDQMATYNTYRRVTLASLTANPLVVVNRYNDSTAYRYSNPLRAEAVQETREGSPFHSWMGIMVMITQHGENVGVDLVSVENICHFEAQALASGLPTDGVGEASNPPVLEAASNANSQSNSNFVEGTFDEEQHYKQCMSNAGRRYLTAVAGYAGGGLPGISNAGRLG